ncbi:uncharacterized protein [Solanum lycopersicum]|uniref:uncharacterized protein n=1 Tax=Solanum lycopersicum TaxID=4081 RepID=UPI0037489108
MEKVDIIWNRLQMAYRRQNCYADNRRRDLEFEEGNKVYLKISPMKGVTYRQQKCYADNRRRDLEFEEGDKVYLKISPMKGVVAFDKKGKWSPRYVGPYEILQRVCKIVYELKLHSELALAYPVFHVSMLKKCIGDPESILPIEGLGVKDNLSYEEVQIQILDRNVKKFRNKEVVSIKLL